MLSIEESKKILNGENKIYTTEETKAVVQLLYQFAEVALNELKKITNEED